MNAAQSTSSAFSSPEVRVVDASAGSGKTYALARRYVQLVLHPRLAARPASLRGILALTFTNKSAFEMKARILQFLKKIALKDLSATDAQNLLKPVGLSEDEASERSYAVMDYLIRHYNFFQVQTIDKFINALLCGCAFKIGLTANFRIKTNSHEYLLYSLDQMIDAAAEDAATRQTLEAFLHQYLYIENRSGWFPKDDMLGIIKTLFGQHNTFGKAFVPSAVSIEDLIKEKKKVLGLMHQLRDVMPDGVHARFRNSFEKFINEHTQGFDVDTLSNYFAREALPLRKHAEADPEAHRLWEKIRRGLIAICEHEAASIFNPYIRIFDRIRAYFQALSARDDVLFLEELNTKAGALFDTNHVTVEELYYRLATRFHHYLVDEFQDTSRLQWTNMETMIEEALSTGGTLFYVGDKKQAIYGFRGGEVKLFDHIKDRFAMFNVKVDVLSRNWRSHKQIVDLNNQVFSWDNLDRFIAAKQDREARSTSKSHPVVFSDGDLKEIHNVFADAIQTPTAAHDQGYVRIEPLKARNRQERDEMMRPKLTGLINELTQRFRYQDIAILTRGNQDIEMMTTWLLEEHIPVESERTSNIQQNPLVAEIMAFLRFLDSPIDNIAFAQFILGDIFTRATGMAVTDAQAFIFSLRERVHTERDVYIYTEFRKAYPEIWAEFIDPFFKSVGLYPLYELVISLMHTFKVLIHFPEAQGFFMHLLELIRKQEEESADISAFITAFDQLAGEDLYVEVADTDAVKLLTIHKAKGLEFPVAIIPFLGMDVKVGASRENYQQSFTLQPADNALSLIRLKGEYYRYSDALYQIYREEYKKAFIAELNNIYVALTRPRYELYAFVPAKVGNKFNIARLLLPEEAYEQGTRPAYPSAKPDQAVQDKQVCRLAPTPAINWIAYLNKAFGPARALHHRPQRLKGEVCHYLLAWLNDLNQQDLDQRLAGARAQAAVMFPLYDRIDECAAVVKKLVTAPELKRFFYPEAAEVFTEKAVVDANGETRRIDRMLVGPKQVVIVDFKSRQEGAGQARDKDADQGTDAPAGISGSERQQMQAYLRIAAVLYPHKTVEGYLIYMDCGKAIQVN
jgi:ATP-dependent exoDNAse (exonuclease V) beta subunit